MSPSAWNGSAGVRPTSARPSIRLHPLDWIAISDAPKVGRFRMDHQNLQADAVLPPEVQARLAAWRLEADGALITTRSSWVLPVRRGTPMMLKLARIPDERSGYALMRWWNGQGAAEIFEAASDALLLERAGGSRSLAALAWSGEDDRAAAILCETAARLHARRSGPYPDLHPLETWFQPLLDFSDPPAWLRKSADIARALLAAQQAITPLHGDLHHDNVLDFGARGWKAIDPHGLLGARAFDYANIFTNPDLSDPERRLAVLPGRLEARLAIVTRMGGIEAAHLLRWIVAWTGLSAAWFLGDGDEAGAAIDREINGIASRLL
jgi:streptomycin 6-kinase